MSYLGKGEVIPTFGELGGVWPSFCFSNNTAEEGGELEREGGLDVPSSKSTEIENIELHQIGRKIDNISLYTFSSH